MQIYLPKLIKYHLKEFGKTKEDIIRWVAKALSSSPVSEALNKLLENGFSLKWEKCTWDVHYVLESKEKVDIR